MCGGWGRGGGALNNEAGTLSKAMQVLHVKHPHGVGCMAVHMETERLFTIEPVQVATATMLNDAMVLIVIDTDRPSLKMSGIYDGPAYWHTIGLADH